MAHLLVTGFCDWRETADVWRCRDNPSGRLLTGRPTCEPAPRLDGPLPARLGAGVDFALLPVTWGAARRLPLGRYEAVVHLGLGVYDTPHRLQPERGAFNRRRGTDAAGATADTPLDPDGPDVLAGPPAVGEALAAVDGLALGPYAVQVAVARPDNAFLCNETHWHALAAIRPGGRLQRAFFLHLPAPADGEDDALADAVATLVRHLLA